MGWSYSFIKELNHLKPIQERLKAVPGAAKLLLELETTKCTDYIGSKHLSSSAKLVGAGTGLQGSVWTRHWRPDSQTVQV